MTRPLDERATADDVLEVLRAHPRAAMAAIPRFRVVGPWQHSPSPYNEGRWFRRAHLGDDAVEVHHCDQRQAQAYGLPGPGWWVFGAEGKHRRVESADEGKRMEDDRLREAGVVLLDNEPTTGG